MYNCACEVVVFVFRLAVFTGVGSALDTLRSIATMHTVLAVMESLHIAD